LYWEDKEAGCRIILKKSWDTIQWQGLDYSDSRKGTVVDSCGDSNKPSGCIQCWKIPKYSILSIIRAWFNRFAARQCIFKEKFYFPWVSHLFKCFVCQSVLVYYNLESTVLAFTSPIDILPLFFLNFSVYVNKFQCINLQ
jgi:hypothetical protein